MPFEACAVWTAVENVRGVVEKPRPRPGDGFTICLRRRIKEVAGSAEMRENTSNRYKVLLGKNE